MPSTEHAISQGIVSKHGHSGMHSPLQKGQPRRGTAIAVGGDEASSLLSPILSHLPSLSALPAVNGVLPSSRGKQVQSSENMDQSTGVWQVADLRDGNGKSHLLLLSHPHHALQIFRFHSSTMSDDPHVREHFDVPEEVFSIPKLESPAVRGSSADERVLSARLSDQEDWGHSGPTVVIISSSQSRNATNSISLVLVSLRTGKTIRRTSLGDADLAVLEVSRGIIAVAVSRPSSLIHLFHAQTLDPICAPVSDAAIAPTTSLPVIALSGRLLAYVVAECPIRPGPDGLGPVVTARSLSRSSVSSPMDTNNRNQQLSTAHDGPSTALLSTAAEIGGGVARGVWAGIRFGARAARQARNARLARSAPTDAGTLGNAESQVTFEGEARSLEESSVLSASFDTTPATSIGGEWFKVVDVPLRHPLCRGSRNRSPSDRPIQHTTQPSPRVIAHCRCPSSLSLAPMSPEQHHRLGRHLPRSISRLSFNKAGTQLLVAPADGRIMHLFELHPSGLCSTKSSAACQALHLYELRRGSTVGAVREIKWSDDGRWVGVATGKGTIHVFPINPTGGPVSAATHVCIKNGNPQQLYPLSTVVTASARLRPARDGSTSPGQTSGSVLSSDSFIFAKLRQDPLRKGTFCQDILIFRSSAGQAEQGRLVLRAAGSGPGQAVSPGPQGRSALTEMMRAQAGSVGVSDLEVSKSTKARWLLPAGLGLGEETIVVTTREPWQTAVQSCNNLAHSEIQTYCANARILPGTIYLSHQIDFFSAQPIDESSPLSAMDAEARMKRLTFRQEVEARPTSPEVKSFDEPLLSALHTVIEAEPASQLPGLPNGHPYAVRWRSIPIRSVALNLGEGVDRVRREYARAQHSRARRRADQAAQNGLSFEEDTVLDIQVYPEEYDDSGSSPSSALQPATNTDSSVDDGEWGEGWEAEYAKAVEDEGSPEDLVLGLMDEEEEERRAWALKQKQREKDV